MIEKDPKKSFEIMGADVKQTGEQFEASRQKYLRWQDKAANQKFFAGEHRSRSRKEAADLLLEVGIIKQLPDMTQARRHALHQVSVGRPSRAGATRRGSKPAADAARDEAARPRRPGAQVALGIAFFVVFVAAWASATFGGFVSKTFLADPLTMLREGWALFAEHGFAKDIGMTVWRVVGGFVLAAVVARAARHRDGRVQADRGVLRAVRLVRALPAGVRLHPAADPVGRHRRDAEAARDLHRLVLPDRADGRGDRRQRRGATWSRPPTRWARRRRGIVRRVLLPSAAPADRRDAAPRARLGLDLRDRRRADRRVVAASAT